MPFDPRTQKLAQLAVDYSVAAKRGEKVIISGGSEALDFLVELYKAVILKGSHPIVRVGLPNVSDFFYKHATREQLDFFPGYWMDTVKGADCYIGISSDANTRELTNVRSKLIAERSRVLHPISDYICNTREKIRRVSIAYPCQALAQDAEMSLAEYEDFVYGACLIDWKTVGKRLDTINRMFQRGKQVWLTGDKVDLRFAIVGRHSMADKGEENMPGGEIFMAPRRESVNGRIQFEYPAIKNGKEVTDVYLEFQNGKVVTARASKNQDFLRQMLATDKNASYVGEFGIGCNPRINRFTKDLLFDEKINGTIHLALGMAYKQNGGGNDSALHWDIVKDMRKGKIVLDGKAIQDRGAWRL